MKKEKMYFHVMVEIYALVGKIKKEYDSRVLWGSCLLIIKVTVKNWPFTNRFYLTFFLNSIGLLAKKKKNHNNIT